MLMNKRTLALVVLVAAAAAVLSVSSAFAKGHKVDICHRPPGNPDNVHVISISLEALPAHLAHGDHWSFGGACYVLVSDDVGLFFDQWEAHCADSFGGFLTSIHSDDEDDFVSFVVDPDATGGITALIGGFRVGACTYGVGWEGAWSDGSPWDYENWRASTSEPRCFDGPQIQFWPNTNGGLSGWNDVPVLPWRLAVCRYVP